MRRIIENPQPTLELAFEYVMEIKLPHMPHGDRLIVIDFARSIHTAGAVWHAAITRKELQVPGNQRSLPASVQETLRMAELTLAQSSPLTLVSALNA